MDVLGVSCDSFDGNNRSCHRRRLRQESGAVSSGCNFKLNTVVCTLNWEQDMAATIEQVDPFRWKVFQALIVEDENSASSTDVKLDNRKRDARSLLITLSQPEAFCAKHRHLSCFVPEPSELIASSYLILTKHLYFLNREVGSEKTSRSILDMGVAKAMEDVRFDKESVPEKGRDACLKSRGVWF